MAMAEMEAVVPVTVNVKPVVCVWKILQRSLRNWNGKGKEHDLEKIAHYAELAWTMEAGDS